MASMIRGNRPGKWSVARVCGWLVAMAIEALLSCSLAV
jgi:hypothetical protein